MESQIPTVTLNNGQKQPQMAFGLGTAWFKPDPSSPFNPDLVAVIKEAIAAGYRHFDTSEYYGTEAELAQALRESGVPREEFYLMTKARQNVLDIPKAIEGSLKKLGVEYVDLYLLHEPWHALNEEPKAIQTAWKAMEDVLDGGLTRSIGLSSFLRHHVEAVLETAKVRPAVNQIEYHPYLQRLKTAKGEDYVPWLQAQGIVVQSYFGLVPLTHARAGPLLPVLDKIAAKHGVGESAVLFAWQRQQGIVSISTTKKPERFREYFQTLNVELSQEEIEEINTVGSTHHFRTWYTQYFDPQDRS